MIARKIRLALVAAGIIAPKCTAFGGFGPEDFGMNAWKVTLTEAKANVAYFSKALRKVDGDDMVALAEGFRNLDAAEAEVTALQDAYDRWMINAYAHETY